MQTVAATACHTGAQRVHADALTCRSVANGLRPFANQTASTARCLELQGKKPILQRMSQHVVEHGEGRPLAPKLGHAAQSTWPAPG